ERLDNPAEECRVLVLLGGHVNPWREPLRDCVPLLRRSMAAGLESGELQFAAYAALNLLYTLLATGTDLDQVIAEAADVVAHFRKLGPQWAAAQAVILRQVARRLKGVTQGPRTFDDEEFKEADFLATASQNGPALTLYQQYRLEAAYLLDDLTAA